MAFNDENFIFAKVVDRSLLRQGFTLPVKMLWGFKQWFGELAPGESRSVIIRLKGREFFVKVGNRNFDREKWPNHPEMYQLRYNEGCDLSNTLKEIFSKSRDYISRELQKVTNAGGSKRSHVRMPQDCHEQLLLFRTGDPYVWDAEVVTADENRMAEQSIKAIDEHTFESSSWNDATASVILKPAVVKIRKLDRAIGNNLKRVYEHRCQLCGEQVGAPYSTHVDEIHHIEPFIQSLNNDVSNLLVLCPNHHRIIHAAHPMFSRSALAYTYPNGLVEKIKVNFHLR